jgi:acyl carrier protein
MIDTTVARKRIQESLVGFPSTVTDAYLAFVESRDLGKLDVVVLGVLTFYLARKPRQDLEELPGETRLVEDLGCDSLTMMDTVFMVESLFDIKIDDDELEKIVTLDDLRAQLRRQFNGSTSPKA